MVLKSQCGTSLKTWCSKASVVLALKHGALVMCQGFTSSFQYV